jgi:hypothetical protein
LPKNPRVATFDRHLALQAMDLGGMTLSDTARQMITSQSGNDNA